jgi:carnitine 3-dehydrogenase
MQPSIGFIVNRIQAAVYQESFALVRDGVCSAEDVGELRLRFFPSIYWILVNVELAKWISDPFVIFFPCKDNALTQGPGLRWALLGPFMTLHLAGGKGGLPHSLDHFGKPIQSWIDDLKQVEIDEATKIKLLKSTAEYYGRLDIEEVIKERDELLISLIAGKKKKDALP